MSHLYELSTAYKQLLDTQELNDEECAEAIGNIEELFKDKAINIGKLVLSLEADAEVVNQEITRLSARKTALLNRSKRLKAYLAENMEVTDTPKITHELFNISLVSNPPSVNVFDEKEIPEEYWRIIPETREVDKKAILAVYKDKGEVVSGTEIISDKRHIVIK